MSQRRRTKKFLEGGYSPKGKYPRGTKKFKHTDDEDGPMKPPSGMRKQYLYANKDHDWGYVGTNFRYLRRYLKSRVGQDWDDVYSEICESADKRTFQGNHLREWLEYAIDVKTRIEDGKIVDQHGHDVTKTFCRDSFYVHPETNLLEMAKPQKRKGWWNVVTKTVFECDGQLFHQHEGIWYRVEMKEAAQVKNRWGYLTYTAHSDQFLVNSIGYENRYTVERMMRDKYGYSPNGKPWHCIHKESANSKEIAKLKKQLAEQDRNAA